MSKAGRTIVVTGGGRGIGSAIAGEFIESGDRVVVLDLIPPDPTDGLTHIETDVSDPASVNDAFAELPRVDVLVNNAGVQRVGLVGNQSPTDWATVIGINLTGAFHCVSAAIPLLKESKGSIVSIASSAAFVGLPGRAAYSAAKAGLIGLTRVLAIELAPHSVRANVVAPGFTATGLVNQAIADGSLQSDWMMDRVPMQRLAEPSEIADAVEFLSSPRASFITGQVLVVDGGWTVQGIGHGPGWLMAGEDPTPGTAG